MQLIKQLFPNTGQEEDRGNIKSVVQGNTRFALELYQKLHGTEGNLFFSPYSISSALAMTYAGARKETEVQMARTLHFLINQKQIYPAFALLEAKLEQTGKQGHVQMNVANALWPRKDSAFLKEYLNLLKKFFGVLITPIDYDDEESARQIINSWIEKRTASRIKDLLQPGVLNSLTRLVLVNAIYFKGEWAIQFDPELTSGAAFFTAPNLQVQVPMMTRKNEFRYAERNGLQILELPYNGVDLSMIVLLPRAIDGLAELEESFSVENLGLWTENLEATEVDVSLPKFEINFPFRLDGTLKALGMVDAFSNNADFSGMNGNQDLFISAVLHKAYVSVNEQGTEAAAATAVIVQTKALSIPNIVFRADHPFIFLIRENTTGSILFIGRVVNPV
jgi:serine protease inhibitor